MKELHQSKARLHQKDEALQNVLEFRDDLVCLSAPKNPQEL